MTIFRGKIKAEKEANKRNKKLKEEEKLWCVYPYGEAFAVGLGWSKCKIERKGNLEAAYEELLWKI